MSDFDDLRNFDDDDDFADFGSEDIAFDQQLSAAQASARRMSPVEQIILAIFVLLNIAALVVIVLLVTNTINP